MRINLKHVAFSSSEDVFDLSKPQMDKNSETKALGQCSRFVLTIEKPEKTRLWMRVLGIDPGLRIMGWGVIDADGPRLRHVANGHCVSDPGAPLAERLLSLYVQLTEILRSHRPDTAAVEKTFVNKDGAATLKLGQARGIALLVPAMAGLTVGEYAPNTVKKTVVGVGHAAKTQVDHMVRVQLAGVVIEGADAADALAVAICHVFHQQTSSRLADAIEGARR